MLQIIHNEITILSDDFLVFSDFTRTRGHCYKLFKGCSRVNAHKYFLSNRITEIWNALPSAVVEASSSIVLSGCWIALTERNIVFFSFLFVYSIICDYVYIHVCDHVRASVSGLFKDPSCPVDFCPLKSSFIHAFIHSSFKLLRLYSFRRNSPIHGQQIFDDVISGSGRARRRLKQQQ